MTQRIESKMGPQTHSPEMAEIAPVNKSSVDMSPEAIDQRLRELSRLWKLGMAICGAKPIQPAERQGGNPPAYGAPCSSWRSSTGAE